MTPTPRQIAEARRLALRIPFADGGNGPDGADCAGILCFFWGRLGIHIPHPAALTEADVMATPFYQCFEPITDPAMLGCVLNVVRMPGQNGDSAHLGTIVEPGKVLHTHRNVGALVTPVRRLRIVSEYRVRALAS